MRVELQSLSGFVILEGDFDIDPTRRESTQVWEEFEGKPSRIRFNAILSNAEFKLQSAEGRAKKMHVRMFASVVQSLDDQGVIRVHPLAVF
jgi:hypothetical protein